MIVGCACVCVGMLAKLTVRHWPLKLGDLGCSGHAYVALSWLAWLELCVRQILFEDNTFREMANHRRLTAFSVLGSEAQSSDVESGCIIWLRVNTYTPDILSETGICARPGVFVRLA